MNKFFSRKVVNENNIVIGYYINHNLYDMNSDLKGKIYKNKFYKDQQLIGYLETNKLYYNDDTYIGKITSNYRVLFIILSISLFMIVGFGITFSIPKLFPQKDNSYQIIEVTTIDGVWGTEEKIDLLYNEYAGKDENGINLIAPGSSSSSKFVLYNKNEDDILYKIEFHDNNEGNVLPIQYRLKLNDNYVAGDSNTWLYLSDLGKQDLKIKGKSKAYYEIEWKWNEELEDYKDTSYGIAGNKEYNIQITISEVNYTGN